MQNLLIKRRLLILSTTGILATPPLIAIALRGHQLFQYDDTLRAPDEKVAALLNGEQLVPPPPLPPEVFATREVEQLRPALVDASRDWNLLDPDFRTRLLLVYKIMHEQYGYQMALLEGYRSPERQDRLAKMGGSVTNAAAFQSYHQYGLAADNAFLRDGKLVISEKDPWAMRGYQLYGQVAEQVVGWPVEIDGSRARRISQARFRARAQDCGSSKSPKCPISAPMESPMTRRVAYMARIACLADMVSQPNAYKLRRPAVAAARLRAHARDRTRRIAVPALAAPPAHKAHKADATHHQNSTQSTRT